MVAQVLVRDLTFGKMDGNNNPPPLNAESCNFDNSHCRRCRHIVLPNNSPSRRRCVLPYDSPSEAVDCCVSTSEEILRSIALNVLILPIPSRSGLGVIKVQEEKRKM